MAVAFDAVGPSAAGAGNTGSTTLSWTHTPSGTPTAVLAGVSVGTNGSDAALVATATYGGTSMPSLSKVHAGTGGTGTSGFIQLFGLAGPASGAKTVAVSVSGGTPGSLAGGSLSYTGTGVTAGSAFGAIGISYSSFTTTGTVTLTGTSTSSRVAGFIGDGSGGETITTGTSRYKIDETTSLGGACGCTIAGDIASLVGTVTIGWSQTSDWYGATCVELLVPGGSPLVNVASGTGAALTAATIPLTVASGPNYPLVAADLGGGSGVWSNAFLAEGPP